MLLAVIAVVTAVLFPELVGTHERDGDEKTTGWCCSNVTRECEPSRELGVCIDGGGLLFGPTKELCELGCASLPTSADAEATP